MKDRSVQYPKRYRLTKISGTDDIYDLDPTPGEITEEGTLINKGTLLSDDTAAKFFESLVGTETVNQVLGLLGDYNLHWWRRRRFSSSISVSLDGNQNQAFGSGLRLEYSTELYIKEDNSIDLKPPVSTVYTGSSLAVLRGKYWKNPYEPSRLWFSDSNATTTDNFSIYAHLVTASIAKTYGDWEYLQSHDRDTYPDSGESDGYEYQYLGIPFDNAVTAPSIATGEYTGTGTYGSANPNTLTFDFEPKLVIILWDDYRMIGSFLGIYIHGTNYMTSGLGTYSSNGANPVSTNGMSISWYGDDADRQFNRSNTIYKYIALG